MGRGRSGGAAIAAGKKASRAGTKSRKAAAEKVAAPLEEKTATPKPDFQGKPDFLKKSKATVRTGFDANEQKEIMRRAHKLLGDKVDKQDLASLAGAPDDASVRVVEDWRNNSLAFITESPTMSSMRTLHHNSLGELVLHNDIFTLSEGQRKGTGIGTKVLARQVEHAAALGVKKIETLAARSEGAIDPATGLQEEGFNGYYTWARLGYDANIPSQVKGKLPPGLKGAKRISELMSTKGGSDWWREHGVSTNMTFDLTPGSYSRRTLEGYMRKRGFAQ